MTAKKLLVHLALFWFRFVPVRKKNIYVTKPDHHWGDEVCNDQLALLFESSSRNIDVTGKGVEFLCS